MTTVLSPVHSLLNMITVRLDESNFITWSFQLESLLEGNDLFGFLDGSHPCPAQFVFTEDHGITTTLTQAYKDWKKTDRALISLIIATLSPEAMDYVVGCNSLMQAWSKLQQRYASVSRSTVMQLKTDFQTIQKGSDSIEKFLLRISKASDQLKSLGVRIPDEDVVVGLNGLPAEFDMIRTVIKARETPILLTEFRSQLLGAESDINNGSLSLNTLTAMLARNNIFIPSGNGSCSSSSTVHQDQHSNSWNGNGNGNRSNWNTNSYTRNNDSLPECQICHKRGHIAITCNWRIPDSQNIDSSSVVECQICGRTGHTALDCEHRANFAYQGPPNSN